MSPAINEELLVLAMCAYGGLVLMVCYDAIRIFRRVFRASIIRVIVEDFLYFKYFLSTTTEDQDIME